MEAIEPRPASMPKKLALSPGWLLFAALALAIPAGALLFAKAAAPQLPVLAELPSFSLTDEHGRPFTREEMAGRVWVADFVFTNCPDACPRLTQKMKHLQDRLVPLEQGGNIGLVSISVDPERDTPAKLLKYGESYGARDRLWRFVTGPQLEVERTVVKGFHMAMAKVPLEKAQAGQAKPIKVAPLSDADLEGQAFDIMHGERLVLVDRLGQIRGYYDADDQDKLLRDARSLTTGGRG
jgi:protein SCO1/2